MVRIPSATKLPEPSPEPATAPSDDARDDRLPTEAAVELHDPEREAGAGVIHPAPTAGTTDAASQPSSDGATPAAATPPDDVPPTPNGANAGAASPVPPVDDRRPFRVVITCKPAADGRWSAFIAMGRIDALGKPAPVDPVFETVACDAISDALDAVEGVYAAADARWTEAPRNKAAPLATPAARAPSPKQQAAIDTALQRREERQTAKRAAREGKGGQVTTVKASAAPSIAPPPVGEKLALF